MIYKLHSDEDVLKFYDLLGRTINERSITGTTHMAARSDGAPSKYPARTDVTNITNAR